MAIEVERDSPTWQPPTDDAEDAVTEPMRDLARWLYRQLRAEYEHLTSDAAIDETLAANANRPSRPRANTSSDTAAHPAPALNGAGSAGTPTPS